MKKNFYSDLCEMTKEAIDELDLYEASGDGSKVLNKIKAIAVPCVDGEEIRQSIKDDLPIREQLNFQNAVFNILELKFLKGGNRNNPGVRSCLEYFLSITNDLSSKENESKKAIVFYSWQARLPNKTNRNLIKNCVEKAIKEINNEIIIESKISIDSDTSNTPGSPDIINTILKKIDSSSIFIADVSLLSDSQPNSNVMFELGYALKTLGDRNIVMVFNEAFGELRDLPFDLGFKRQLIYRCSENEEDVPSVKKDLTSKLKISISLILKNIG